LILFDFRLLVPPTILNDTDCRVPTYVSKIYRCVTHQNFLFCPKSLFNATEKCETTIEFLQANKQCGENQTELFVIDYRFWLDEESENAETTTTLKIESTVATAAATESTIPLVTVIQKATD
jgi:hypothetical protein